MENDLSERLTIDVRRSSVGQKGGGCKLSFLFFDF